MTTHNLMCSYLTRVHWEYIDKTCISKSIIPAALTLETRSSDDTFPDKKPAIRESLAIIFESL